LSKLSGRVVAFPSLNPTGHLVESRFPLFEPGKDPNRCWPEYRPKIQPVKDETDLWDTLQRQREDEPGPQQRSYEKIAEIFKNIHPDFHVDLHTFSTLSMPFIFMDRVFSETPDVNTALSLWNRTNDMVEAMGLTVLRERPAWLYVKSKLHRSTSGYTLNCLRIPSCTVELGAMNVSVPSARDAGIASLNNLLYWSKMLEGQPKQITECQVIKFTEPHRYLVYPQTETTGIVDFQVEVGSSFKKGDLLALVRNMNGTVSSKVVAEMDGYLIAWFNGIAKYEKNSLGMVAVPDGQVPVVLTWTDDLIKI